MPGLGGLAGLSGAYSGYNEGVGEEATARTKKYAIDMQQATDAGRDRTLVALNQFFQSQQGGQAGQAPSGIMSQAQPPMQPPPGGPSPMGPPGQSPVQPTMQAPQFQGGGPPMPQARPTMMGPGGGGQPPPMMRPPMGGAPGQLPPGGQQQSPGGQQQGQSGALTWPVVLQMAVRANPSAPPGVISRIVDSMVPIMQQQSQLEWRERSMTMREDIERMREGFQTQLEGQRQGGRSSLEDQRAGNRSDLESQRQGGRMDLHPTAQAVQRLLENNPDATPTEIMDVVRAGHPQSATEFKAGQQGQAVKSFVSQLDSAIADIQDSQKGGAPVTGITGSLSRGAEFVGGIVGADTGTKASDFQTKIRALQQQWPRMIAGTTRLSADERAHVEEIIKGLGTFTSAPQAASALQEVKNIIQQRYGTGEGARQSGGGQQGGKSLKALTDEVKQKVLKLRDQGFSRDDVEDWLRKRGYDPGSD